MLLSSALTSFVLLPLYIYPFPGSWNVYYDSIAAHPNVTFLVVINPSSGPGSTTYPDPLFQIAIAKLKSYPNTQTIGYVHTTSATRLITAVETDIATYAGWSSYLPLNISLNGIFFDEAPSAWTLSTSAYMTTAVTTAKTAFTLASPYIVFNPGTMVDSRFFALANSINVWEGDYASYTSAAVSNVPTNLRSLSTIMVHGFSGTLVQQTQLLEDIYHGHIGGFFITTQPDYDVISALWAGFCNSLAIAT